MRVSFSILFIGIVVLLLPTLPTGVKLIEEPCDDMLTKRLKLTVLRQPFRPRELSEDLLEQGLTSLQNHMPIDSAQEVSEDARYSSLEDLVVLTHPPKEEQRPDSQSADQVPDFVTSANVLLHIIQKCDIGFGHIVDSPDLDMLKELVQAILRDIAYGDAVRMRDPPLLEEICVQEPAE